MAKIRGASFVLLATLVVVGCDGGVPTAPTTVLPTTDPVEISSSVVVPYPLRTVIDIKFSTSSG